MDEQKIKRELAAVLNANGVDNHLNIPDYILAGFLSDHLFSLGRLFANLEKHVGLEQQKAVEMITVVPARTAAAT